MALRKLSMRRWEKLVEESDRHRAELLGGYSPGYAAAKLGISRQAVHKAVHRGDLDALMLVNDEGKLSAFLIPDKSIVAFAKRRAQKAAG